MENLIKEILKDKDFKLSLSECLARKVADEYHYTDCEGQMIKEEIRQLIKDEAKEIINDLAENYYEINIKSLIEETLKKFTKEDIISLIK